MLNAKKMTLAALAGALLLGGTLAADPAYARRGWDGPELGAHHQEPWRDGRNDHDDWRNDHDNGRHNGWRNGRNDGPDWRGGYRFVDRERVVVREYYRTNYHRPKPAKIRYVVGRPLARTVVYREVPEPVLVDLRPAPRGYRYVEVDGNVLLMQDLTRLIVDAITY